MEGVEDGDALGTDDGRLGKLLGPPDGIKLGIMEGFTVGNTLGLDDGLVLETALGLKDIVEDGAVLGQSTESMPSFDPGL